MNKILKLLTMVRYHIYYSATNPKVWAAGLLILTAIFKVVYPFARISEYYNRPVNFSAAALPFSNNYSILLIYCALLLIFSDMPFNNSQQVFLLTRSGKRLWYISQLLYIIVVSIFTALTEILASWVIICGHISFANSWGAVENSIAQSGELILEYDVVGYFSYNIISNVSPLQTFAWCVLIGTFIYTVFGTLIYMLNIISKKVGGIICGAVLIGYHALMWNFIHPRFKWLAVIDWGNIDYIDILRNSTYPTPEFVISTLTGVYIAAAAVVAVCSRKKADIL